MAKKKRKTSKRRKAPKRASNPAPKRRVRHRRARRASNPAPVRRTRRSHARKTVHRRRRSNPGGGAKLGMKRVGMLAGLAVIGGVVGVMAGQAVESRVAQPARTLGIGELLLAAGGVLLGAKFGQPVLGLGFAAGLGAQGAKNVINSFGTAAVPPPAMPAGAAPPPALAAVVDVDDDINGHEGLAAVEDALGEDEYGDPQWPSDSDAFDDSPWVG